MNKGQKLIVIHVFNNWHTKINIASQKWQNNEHFTLSTKYCCTVSSWPFSAAQWRGVSLPSSVQCGSQAALRLHSEELYRLHFYPLDCSFLLLVVFWPPPIEPCLLHDVIWVQWSPSSLRTVRFLQFLAFLYCYGPFLLAGVCGFYVCVCVQSLIYCRLGNACFFVQATKIKTW